MKRYRCAPKYDADAHVRQGGREGSHSGAIQNDGRVPIGKLHQFQHHEKLLSIRGNCSQSPSLHGCREHGQPAVEVCVCEGLQGRSGQHSRIDHERRPRPISKDERVGDDHSGYAQRIWDCGEQELLKSGILRRTQAKSTYPRPNVPAEIRLLIAGPN